MVNKKTAIQEKNTKNPLMSLPLVAVLVFLLIFTPLLVNVSHAQYGAGDYGGGEFSGQQATSPDPGPGDPSDPSDDSTAPSDDSEVSDDSSQIGATDDDELAETGQALTPLSIAALSIVVIVTLSIFFVRPKNKQKE